MFFAIFRHIADCFLSDLGVLLSINKRRKRNRNAVIYKFIKRYFCSTPPSPFGEALSRWAWSPPCRRAFPHRRGWAVAVGAAALRGHSCVRYVIYSFYTFSDIRPIVTDFPCSLLFGGAFRPAPRSGRRSRSPKISGTPQGGSGLPGTPQAQSAGGTKNGSNFGAVVGVAACRHSGGVNIPQGNIRKG